MKTPMLTALLMGAFSASALYAQTDAQQRAYAEKRDQKLKSEFLKKADWFTNYEKALSASKRSGKAIFAFFTRSYSP